ncbi:MAG: hypothetical protein AB8G96_03110 [Phycisphaerales bacterium]
MHRIITPLALATTLATTSFAAADLVLPVTENFDAGAASWFDGASVGEVDWVASGGAIDNGGFITDAVSVPAVPPPFGLTAFRAQDEFGSSDGRFEGDWIAAGATQLSFFVRHDGAAPLNVFARFAGPANFPGAAGVVFQPVLPGTWTEVFIDVTESSAQLVLEGSTHADVFSNIGHLQIGFTPGEADFGTTVQFDIDGVRLVPAPAGLAMLSIAGLVAGRRRRD